MFDAPSVSLYGIFGIAEGFLFIKYDAAAQNLSPQEWLKETLKREAACINRHSSNVTGAVGCVDKSPCRPG